MSGEITLFCIVDGESSKFLVDILPTKTVGHLKNAIKDMKENDLKDIDADRLILWATAIPSIPIRTIKLDNLTSDDTANMPPLLLDESDDLISEKFEAELPRKTIHVVIKLPLAGKRYSDDYGGDV
ncbi:hypothetical protein BGZ76_002137, partial [Entomortierella beljakovae]